MRWWARIRDLEQRTRPLPPAVGRALAARWDGLPAHVKTPAQLIGRRSLGCEGTHGVFPRCNFSCKPCYHSADANKVAVDGPHTITEVGRQVGFLSQQRGPGAHSQLIGGEVSLLSADDHAATIAVMRAAGRHPMSFTHGDIDEAYLRALVTGPDGKVRLPFVSFAGHFDTTMYGRRGAEKPTTERALNPFRKDFAAMFSRLRTDLGVKSYLAHNMTVTPDNVDQVADLIKDCHAYGYRMFSFQPAAFVGNTHRWTAEYRSVTDDDVWAQIERGAGTRLPYRAVQFGDLRCNRVVWGVYVGDRFVPTLDDQDPADLRVRDLLFETFPGNALGEPVRAVRAVKYVRSIVSKPRSIPMAVGWARRFVRRAGGLRQLRHGMHPVTFVLHNFIDADLVGPAWADLQQGRLSDDPARRATQERLQACAYTMGHPDTGELVPACVQHSVLDPEENRQLVQLLPLSPRRSS